MCIYYCPRKENVRADALSRRDQDLPQDNLDDRVATRVCDARTRTTRRSRRNVPCAAGLGTINIANTTLASERRGTLKSLLDYSTNKRRYVPRSATRRTGRATVLVYD